MHRLVYLISLCLLASTGCNGRFLPAAETPSTVNAKHFVIVTAGANDSLVSLARTHLKDGDKAWQIAAFNDIERVTPGQKVVIPLAPMNPGGIYKDGYQTVPVLLYGGLITKPSKSKAVYIRDFKRQMAYLNEYGYPTVSLDKFHAFLSQTDQLPPMSIVVTFDTTQSWAYEMAFPILKSLGMKAAFFIRPNDIGAKGRLTWAQVAEMARGGMDFGLYESQIGPSAVENSKAFLTAYDKELTAAKRSFKSKIRRSCRYLAFSGGTRHDMAAAILKKHGYRAGFTRKRGTNPFFTDNFKIKRAAIYGYYSMEQFRQNLTTFRSAELR
jgi:peptidoglycan/xylan/chitin deacetylase (PgdA/CDA1 family)